MLSLNDNRISSSFHLLVIVALAIIDGGSPKQRLQVEAHGTMIDPVSRNSLWRLDGSAPVNYNDIELFCGGIGVTTQHGGKCGVCGDPINMKPPRPHETGGYMVVNRTVKHYFPGSTLDVLIDLDTNHGGYFTFELCRRDYFDTIETESCFERLKFIDGSDRMELQNDHSDKGLKSFSLLMPEDLRECRACILRWNYRAGNNWGTCQDGTEGMGCGPQELYRNCADISIGYQVYQFNNLREDFNSDTSLRDIFMPRKSMRTRSDQKKRRSQNEERENNLGLIEFDTNNNDNNFQNLDKPIE